jgi:hypothetical protein
MRPLFLLVILSIMAGCSPAKKGPVTKQVSEDMKQPDFFPITEGMKLEYRITVDGKAADLIVMGTAVETKEGNRTINTKIQVGSGGWTEEHMVTENGLFLVTSCYGKCDPPRQVLKYPIKAGDTWAQSYKDGETDTEAKTTVLEAESIEVGGSKYKAYPVCNIIKSKDNTATSTTWYVEGVGVVKMRVEDAPKPASFTLELRKITTAK